METTAALRYCVYSWAIYIYILRLNTNRNAQVPCTRVKDVLKFELVVQYIFYLLGLNYNGDAKCFRKSLTVT